jgi:hypothetical protein
VIEIAIIPVIYEAMESVSVDVQGHTRSIGTNGDMISSDIHGDESPSDGC